MANKKLFKAASLAPPPVTNHAGGPAIALGAKEALAKYAAAGMLGDTYYVSAELQLFEVLRLANACEPMFVAKCAAYSRQAGYLKDMPALLLASLTTRGPEGAAAARAAWPHVVDNAKMLRNFCQVIRSGVVGRRNFGTAYRRLAANWLIQKAEKAPEAMLNDTVGNDPSLADVIKMVRPKPQNDAMRALLGYLAGKRNPDHVPLLPERIFEYERYKMTAPEEREKVFNGAPPAVDFRLLDSLGMSPTEWKHVALRASWTMTRMNLNTFKRHGVLEDGAMVNLIANRLRDRESIRNARMFPYQLMAAYHGVARADTDDARMPTPIVEALHDAMEIACENVPTFDGGIVVCPDVSGSMGSAISGARGAPSKIRCVDVAGLIAAVMLRRSDDCFVLPFDTRIHVDSTIDRERSIMWLATKISGYGGGGTDCSLPLQFMAARMKPERLRELRAVIYVSDYESWADRARGAYVFGLRGAEPTGMSYHWAQLKAVAPQAKLICIDLTPNTTAQASTSNDRLNIGGFSDNVFSAIREFMNSDSDSHWVDSIEALTL